MSDGGSSKDYKYLTRVHQTRMLFYIFSGIAGMLYQLIHYQLLTLLFLIVRPSLALWPQEIYKWSVSDKKVILGNLTKGEILYKPQIKLDSLAIE